MVCRGAQCSLQTSACAAAVESNDDKDKSAAFDLFSSSTGAAIGAGLLSALMLF
jgi:hypothetical protein